MPPLFILGIIFGLPLLLSVLLRVKPLYLFVGIVTGYFWVEFLGSTAVLIVRSMVHFSYPDVVTNAGLLLIPVVLTFVLMRKTLSAASLPFQFLLLAGDSLLFATFFVAILSPGTQGAIYSTHIGNIFHQAHDVAIAAVAGLHMLVMFIMRPKKHSKKHK